MVAYRIADARHPIFDPDGSQLHGGRWNSIGSRVIASETYAGALLEILVHANLSRAPNNHMVVRINIPDEIEVEVVSVDRVKDWEAEDAASSLAFGDQWIKEARTAVLKVHSVITRGRENNIILKTSHPCFTWITAEPPETVYWDERLFA